MLLGSHYPRLDEKGRFILPSKFREEFNSGLVLAKGQERCIYVFTQSEFEKIHQQLQQAPLTNKQARDYMRVFLSGASMEVPDKQGRIMIPGALKIYAGLQKDLAFIGAGSRAEIWSNPTWEKYLAEQESIFSETAEEILPGFL